MTDYAVDTPDVVRLGLVVLSTDETLEYEARQVLAGHSARLYHTRIRSADTVTPASLKAMEALLQDAIRLLPENLDVIGYGCTSASVVIGPVRVADLITQLHPQAKVTTPIGAVCAALRALSARRIALVTPYIDQVVAPMRSHLERDGFDIAAEHSFGEGDDRRVAWISEASTSQAVRKMVNTCKPDAVFVSCTNLRSLGIIAPLEAELGCPIVSSNQALLWHMSQLASVQTHRLGPGLLFETEVYA